MMEIKDLRSYHESLKRERSEVERSWEFSLESTLPHRLPRDRRIKLEGARGAEILDDSPAKSCSLLASNLLGTVMPPDREWFHIGFETLGTKEDGKKSHQTYIEKADRVGYAHFSASNLYLCGHEFIQDAVAIGTALMFFDHEVGGKFRFECAPAMDCTITEDAYGMVDEVFHEFEWTAKQIENRFPDAAKSIKVLQDAIEKEPTRRFTVLHYTGPVDDGDTPNDKKMKYIQKYVFCEGSKDRDMHLLEEPKGFHEFPWMVFRWSKAVGSVWGVSPTMNAIHDIQLLYHQVARKQDAIELDINPPMKTRQGNLPTISGRQHRNDSTVPPGVYLEFSDPEAVQPLRPASNLNVADIDVQQQRQLIKDAYFINELLLNPESHGMTATEIEYRQQLIQRLLGPVFLRLTEEFLRPLVIRAYKILYRGGLLDNPPQDLRDKALKPTFVSPLARAQMSAEVLAARAVMAEAVAYMRDTGDMSLADVIDAEFYFRQLANMTSAPTGMIRSTEEVERRRKNREQMQQAAQVAEVAERAAGAAQKGASALGEMNAQRS